MGFKAGICSRSSDPIHIGRLASVNWLCKSEGLDEAWLVVMPRNPLKKRDDLLDDSLRLEMAQAAIDRYPKFRICDTGFYLPKPSYSIDTLRTLSRNYPNRDFYFIMGADNRQLFPRWKEHEEIPQGHKLLIYPRLGLDIPIPVIYPNVEKVDTPLMEISFTFTRNAYQANKGIRFFLPEGVRSCYYEI